MPSKPTLAAIALAALMMLGSAAHADATGPQPAKAPDRCERERLGWHFYCDPAEEDQAATDTAKAAPAPPPPPAPEDRRPELKAVQDTLARLKANMVLDPTEANVRAYIAFQRQQLDRASMVSDVWRRTLWETPSLDYTLERPVSTLGKRTWQDQRSGERDEVMRHLHERYGLFFVYRSDCPYCHALSPVLHALVAKYGLTVVAVSADGIALADWPDLLVDRGQIQNLGMADKPVPALVLFDSKTQRVEPVGFGYLGADEIEERIFAITKLEPGHDY